MFHVCHMPDIASLLKSRLVSRQLLHLFIPEQIANEDQQYRANLARLVDKAISAYTEARNFIELEIAEAKRPAEEMMRTGRIFYTFGFVDSMENCINATHRALLIFERLKRVPVGAHMDKTTRKLIETHVQKVNDVRDLIEHMDEKILKGEIGPGQRVMLAPGSDQESVVIGTYTLRFDRLASVLQNLHKVGHQIFDGQAAQFNAQQQKMP